MFSMLYVLACFSYKKTKRSPAHEQLRTALQKLYCIGHFLPYIGKKKLWTREYEIIVLASTYRLINPGALGTQLTRLKRPQMLKLEGQRQKKSKRFKTFETPKTPTSKQKQSFRRFLYGQLVN